jgi:hypothetical protein
MSPAPPIAARHRGRSRIAGVVAACHVAALAAGARPCGADVLAELLDKASANARFATPARADVRIDCGGCPTSGKQAIFLGRGDALYVEVRDGQRALLRPGRMLVAKDGKAAEAAVGQAFGDTDLLLEDLVPFASGSLRVPQISDDGPAGVVVTAAPAGPSAYSLVVLTIERPRHAIVRTLYYRDLINNLSKTRRDADLKEVAGGWRPAEIVAESVRQATRTTLTLAWHDAADAPPALFEAAGLEKPSGLSFP